jgi:23S rRNA pseudouridine1911/1915/1917 synthase
VTESGAESDDEFELLVDETQAGGRLDAVIAAAIASLSRAQVQRLIEDGHVVLAGTIATKPGARVRRGDTIEVSIPAPEPLELVPEPIPLAILFEDADLIVIDKPAGLVVHPAPGHATGTLVNALLFHCKDLSGIGGVLRPGIVHRLDKDTTGVMVATKSDRAHAALTAAFAAKSRGEAGALDRTYLAITSPAPPLATRSIASGSRRRSRRARPRSRTTSGSSGCTMPRSCGFGSRPAARTRSGCMPPITAGRSSAIRSMATSPATPGSPRSPARSAGKRSTPRRSRSIIR